MSVNDELLDRLLDGEVTEEEAQTLQAWLETPTNLAQFARRAELHADLRRCLEQKAILSNAVDQCSEQRDLNAVADEPLRPNRRFKRMVFVLATAACLVAAWGIFSMNHVEQRPPRTALVVTQVNAVLTKGGQLFEEPELSAGGYELEQGLLNLRFENDVVVYIEAPACFDTIDEKRVVLHSGRLSANVPPEGIGFTVETPEADVVDFGTEFSIEVESGASEVHVFDGLVRVHPEQSQKTSPSKAVDLHASQAIRITSGSDAHVDIAIAKDRFIRDFNEPKQNYARSIKRLSPSAYYRMPIRDRGLVADPTMHSGVVLTGEGKRPPHARGVFVGGSLRVGADSSGRGGRIDSPPPLTTGQLTLAVFVYLEELDRGGIVATNRTSTHPGFQLALDEDGFLRAAIGAGGDEASVRGESKLPIKTWRHVVMTADGTSLSLYEDGMLIATTKCAKFFSDKTDTMWFGNGSQLNTPWHGRIDELALYDRALTPEEILSLYQTAQEEIAQ